MTRKRLHLEWLQRERARKFRAYLREASMTLREWSGRGESMHCGPC